jgi:hypothetical protein
VTSLFVKPTQKTFDETRPDYEWWDKFRHGKISGFEISGPQAHSINEVVSSWVLGRGVSMELAEVPDKRMANKVEHTNDWLRRFFSYLQGELSLRYEDLLDLGDQYAHISPNGEITWLRPDTVQKVMSKEDANKVDHYTTLAIYDSYIVEEEFYDTKRVRRVKKLNGVSGSKGFNAPIKFVIDRSGKSSSLFIDPPALTEVGATVFPNPLGRIPIVHFANGQGLQEVYGRPVFESLRKVVMSEFDDIAKKSYKGAKLMGTPVPVVAGLLDPEGYASTKQTQENETFIDTDGNTETREKLMWDEDSMFVLGEGGKFSFESPPVGFSKDISSTLDEIRRIIRDKVHVPPHMWGGVNTKKEEAEAQVSPWVRIVEGLRDKLAGKPQDDKLGFTASGGLYELAELWLRAVALSDSKVLVAPTVVRWADLAKEDKQITFEMIKWLHSRGLLRNETALRLTDLVENVVTEVVEAQAEQKTRTESSFDDFGGVGNGAKNPLTDKGKTDLRDGNGADAPRGAAFGGGGDTKG